MNMAAEMAEQPAVLERLVRRRAEVGALITRARTRATLRHRPGRARIVRHGRAVRAIPLRDGERQAGRARVAEPAHPLPDSRRSSRLPGGWHQPVRTDAGGRQRARADARLRGSHGRDRQCQRRARSAMSPMSSSTSRQAAKLPSPPPRRSPRRCSRLRSLPRRWGRCPGMTVTSAHFPTHVSQVLDDRHRADVTARRLDGANRVLTVARGPLLAAASETALKIRETSAIFAEAFSAADLRHGPIAAVTPDVPVLAFSAPGPAAADVAELCVVLRNRGVVGEHHQRGTGCRPPAAARRSRGAATGRGGCSRSADRVVGRARAAPRPRCSRWTHQGDADALTPSTAPRTGCSPVAAHQARRARG